MFYEEYLKISASAFLFEEEVVMNSRFNRHIICPWCGRGEVLADGKAKVTVSAQCPKCGRVFYGDLDTLKTEKGKACKRSGRNR